MSEIPLPYLLAGAKLAIQPRTIYSIAATGYVYWRCPYVYRSGTTRRTLVYSGVGSGLLAGQITLHAYRVSNAR